MNVEMPFIGGSYTARSKNLNAQVCQNFYVETDQTGAKNIIALIGCPGAKLWVNCGVDGEVRKMEVFGSWIYAIIANGFYRIGTDKSYTLLGSIGTSSGWVDLTYDGVYIGIFDSTGGWTWDGSTFAEISDPDLTNISGATYQDGYHIVSKADSDQFFISEQDDPTSWDATDYANAEGSGDSLVSPISVQRFIWLIGNQTTEIWYNSGDTFPFTRNPGGFLSIGAGAKRSIVTFQDELMFLDNTYRVIRKQGLQLLPVSTYQIDYLISTFNSKSDAVGFMYGQEGHVFYELSFPSDSKTICYDLSTGFWHMRASGQSDMRSRANCHVLFGGKNLVGDYENGNIYEYDFETYKDNGEIKRAKRTSQIVNNNNELIFFNSFELDIETGVGNADVVNPQIMLRWSDDSGKTWSNEHWVSMGLIGEYGKRAKWRRLGKSRSRIFEISITDAVKRNIIKGYLDGLVTNG